MAIGVLRLSKRQRDLFALTFITLNIILALLGLFITGWSIFICVTIAPNLYSEKSEVTFVFIVTGMYGMHVLFHHMIGLKICQKCYRQAHKKSTNRLWCVWFMVGMYTMLNIIIIAALALKISKHIVRSMRHSFEKGMRSYLKDPSWKFTVDRLQFKMKCCGIDSYEDWYDIVWLDEFHVDENSDAIKKLRLSKNNFKLPVTPWSCCRVDFPLPCFHDPLQQRESAHLWKEQPSTILDSINTQGCLVALRKPIQSALAAFFLIFCIICILEIVAVMLSRILYTSCRNAIILDDEDGVAPGWIFGRGDCGWSRGPGLEEIMTKYEERKSRDSHTTTRKSENKTHKIAFRIPRTLKSSKSSRPISRDSRASKKAQSSSRSDSDPVSSIDEEALMLN